MAAGGEEGKAGCGGVDGDLYAVLGLKKECSAQDLRSAYRKLALIWHPDRCSASGSSTTVEEAKSKFQAIQGAYSVLSDTNKRFLYDVGVYDDNDDDDAAKGMGEFLGEMAAMMSQATNPNEGGNETFAQLQELFMEMFQSDMAAFCGNGGGGTATAASSGGQSSSDGCDRPSTSSTYFTTATSSSSCSRGNGGGGGGQKRDSADMCSGKAKSVAASGGAGVVEQASTFCFGMHDGNWSAAGARVRAGGGGGKRKSGRRPKASSRHGVSSQDE